MIFSPTTSGPRSGALGVVGTDGITPKTLSVSLSGFGGDFSISVNPSTASVKHAQSVKLNVGVNPLGGAFGQSVALSCSGLPTAATCGFSPSSVVPGSNGASSTLTLNTSGKAPRGTFNVQVIGTAGTTQHAATLRVTVN